MGPVVVEPCERAMQANQGGRYGILLNRHRGTLTRASQNVCLHNILLRTVCLTFPLHTFSGRVGTTRGAHGGAACAPRGCPMGA